MSLFAGTSFVADPNKPSGQAGPSGSSADVSTTDVAMASNIPLQANDNHGPVIIKQELGSAASSSAVNKTGWSAALKFAPAASRKPKVHASSAKPYTGGLSATTSTTSTTLPGGFKPVSNAPNTSATFFSAPVTMSTSSPATAPDNGDVHQSADGKKIFKPPSMTIEGVTGGGGSKKRGLPGGEAEGGGGKRRWKKNKKKQFEMPVHVFQPHEMYNPAQPNDLQMYKQYRRAKREEARTRRQEEEESKRRGSESEGSYYSEDEQEERKDAPRTFAPPTSLYSTEPQPLRAPDYSEDSPATGDEAYARRQAMQFSRNETADEAYARRLALSQPQIQVAPRPPPTFQTASGSAGPSRNETADEAYARRVALSAGAGGGGLGSGAGLGAGLGSSGPPTFIKPMNSVPTFVTSNNAFVPPSTTPFTAAASPPAFVKSADTTPAQQPEDRMAEIAKRIAAAKAIAEKIAAAKGPAAMEVVESAVKEVKDTTGMSGEDVVAMLAKEVQVQAGVQEEITGTFAERMMKRWGHQEGQGLGKQGDGIIHALAAENIDPTKKKSKGGWVQASSSKGKLINTNEDSKKKEEKEKYGEPSQVVCLSNLVASAEEVDDDLQADIGEECGKNGIVERVVIHVIDPPPAELSEAVRVFVVFSGLAGAWQTVKKMDERLFGGRHVRATYFNKARFDKGDRSGRLL